MKNLIRIPLTLALLFAIRAGFCPGQEFYRGELFVTGQHFSQTDGHLTVELVRRLRRTCKCLRMNR